MFKVIVLIVTLYFPYSFAEQEDEKRENHYQVSSGLIKKVEKKIASHAKKGNEKKLLQWNIVLEALQGDRDALYPLGVAVEQSNSAKRKGVRKFWSKVAEALKQVLDSQLMEYEYNFDEDTIEVIKDRLIVSQGDEKEAWRYILLALSGRTVDLVDPIVYLKHIITSKNNEPPEWDQVILELEEYALESYGEKLFIADIRSNSPYKYDVYDSETGEKVGSIDASPREIASEIVMLGGKIDGYYNTNKGRVKWWLKKIGEGNTDYLSYGYWASSKVPIGEENFHERRITGFYHGDNPATDISSVEGYAFYTGKTVGVWKYNTTQEHEVNGFKGDASLTVDFERDTIRGELQNLTHNHHNTDEISDSLLPDKIYLEEADLNSNSQFQGVTSFDNNNNGKWNGQFYNHESSTDAPKIVGGSYSIVTGLREKDMQIEGSFGASIIVHHKE